MVEYKVLVIGGDHHNTLAVIRYLGRGNIPFKVLVHGDYSSIGDIHIAASKYIKPDMIAFCPDDETILEQRIYDYSTMFRGRWVLIPCSDFSAYVIDKSDILSSQNFILPGFKDRKGQVAFMMDKYQQKVWADKNNIPMAKTWSIGIEAGHFTIPADIIYPCIVKPEVSALGKKSDIVICKDKILLSAALVELADKGYKHLLIQQFLIKKYEECAYGCLVEQSPRICGGMIKKLREYPVKGGSTTYAGFESKDCFLRSLAYKVLEKLWEQGYRGMYDIDLLVCEDQVYLNEINFRTSGNGYGMMAAGVNFPLIYFMDVTNKRLSRALKTRVDSKVFFMDELSDIRHVKEGRISLINWGAYIMKAGAFAKWSRDDISGSLAWYKPYVKRVFEKIVDKCRRK
ncbi:hypothetical protein [Veillonella magna]|uniref:hypothetical protein n=1 Tax=Veillonella magna TaxID=464322 RepID=UPI0004009B66|nr:hypothetical protein [Veillonella magna]